MPNIKPISDLENYNDVLEEVEEGEPVFLTENGRGRFAILDIEEYERNQVKIMILSKLTENDKTLQTEDELLTEEQVKEDVKV